MLKKIFFLISLLLALSLITIHFTAEVNPIEFWPFAFLGLSYPIFFVLNSLILGISLFVKPRFVVLIPLIALLITYSSNKATIQLSVGAKNTDEISLMSWNVKNFDLYNWSGNKETREEMFSLLEQNRPEILCLQEFYTEDKGDFNNLKDLKKRLNYKHVYFAKTYTLKKNKHWGLVIFSDYKIIDTGKLLFKEGTLLNTCMYVDLALSETQNVRVYNVHLQSNQLSAAEYKLFEDLGENKDTQRKTVLSFVSKMRTAYVKRAKQTQQVLESKAESPYPSIICGDFNDIPVSYAYKQMSAGMQDAFVEKGLGFGKTYESTIPFLRIDYALFHPMFTINKYERIKEPLSDHYPIKINFKY